MATVINRRGPALMFLAGLGVLGYAAVRYGWVERVRTKLPQTPVTRTTVTLLYGTEKERWLKAALDVFAREHPEIAVELTGMGTLDAVRAIAEGRQRPTVWSPADDVAVNLLDAEWTLGKGAPIVERSGDFAPQPLVLTPLVMIAWEERAKALSAAAHGDPTDWRAVHDLASSPKGWPGLGAPAEWGYVKLGHTAPNASNSGLQTLILMAYAFHGKHAGLSAADVLDERFQKWLKETESAVSKFGASSGTYMRDMVLYGPSKYDLVWNYESVAIGEMAAAQGRWGNLAIYYPTPTLWSNHPFVVPKADWVSPEQRAAARTLREFLLSPAIQARALEAGFRPANPDVRIVTSDPENPWNRLKPYGIRLDVPAAADPPSGEVARLLLETWRRVVDVR